jgi:hypothetical protein
MLGANLGLIVLVIGVLGMLVLGVLLYRAAIKAERLEALEHQRAADADHGWPPASVPGSMAEFVAASDPGDENDYAAPRPIVLSMSRLTRHEAARLRLEWLRQHGRLGS